MSDLQKKIYEILLEIEPAAELDESTDLFESGILDSMGVLYLITRLCEYCRIQITLDSVLPEDFETIERIEQFVKKLEQFM